MDLRRLVNHLWSFADTGDIERNDVNQSYLQPFIAYTTKRAVTFNVSSESTANWEAASGEKWTVPINVNVSKVTKLGPFPFSLGAGARRVRREAGRRAGVEAASDGDADPAAGALAGRALQARPSRWRLSQCWACWFVAPRARRCAPSQITSSGSARSPTRRHWRRSSGGLQARRLRAALSESGFRVLDTGTDALLERVVAHRGGRAIDRPAVLHLEQRRDRPLSRIAHVCGGGARRTCSHPPR